MTTAVSSTFVEDIFSRSTLASPDFALDLRFELDTDLPSSFPENSSLKTAPVYSSQISYGPVRPDSAAASICDSGYSSQGDFSRHDSIGTPLSSVFDPDDTPPAASTGKYEPYRPQQDQFSSPDQDWQTRSDVTPIKQYASSSRYSGSAASSFVSPEAIDDAFHHQSNPAEYSGLVSPLYQNPRQGTPGTQVSGIGSPASSTEQFPPFNFSEKSAGTTITSADSFRTLTVRSSLDSISLASPTRASEVPSTSPASSACPIRRGGTATRSRGRRYSSQVSKQSPIGFHDDGSQVIDSTGKVVAHYQPWSTHSDVLSVLEEEVNAGTGKLRHLKSGTSQLWANEGWSRSQKSEPESLEVGNRRH
ncbi:uncharacterized protein I303_102079 [Kwoniella dejecticola CBS 10117]|uniref:Uncharacterized protein n=1 Tax=Kwoniella dejecticola CBS 10117 TaxID=1296121 RepID=A0A1A6ABY3_9TREE|nr:uncharacterized protein I303_01780 [Kwoniella dejecticola CBS 10117]OBR87572.1 hypothetical protein I303_01780 [Kwoniella dejecticola CBS 10117]